MPLPLDCLYAALITTTLFGLIIGSFLNVVIARYPIMLENEWRKASQDYLGIPLERKPRFNLITPRSQCPQCHTPIKWYHNIPVLSYIALGARCANCKKQISMLYPSVEILTGLLSLFVVAHFSLTWQAGAALLLTWVLITLSFIDFKTQLLPDSMTLTTLWLGLLLSLFLVFITPYQAIAGAATGYMLPWLTAKCFTLIRKKEGMGHGDFKLLAMLGAWFGAYMILNIILIAVFLALVVSLLLLAMRKIKKQEPIPFGPFIAIAGWISMMTGPILMNFLFSG